MSRPTLFAMLALCGNALAAPPATPPVAPPAKVPARFLPANGGTVWDRQEGLLWTEYDNSWGRPFDALGKEKQKLEWEEAVAHCKELRVDGNDDWRLPTKEEAKSLFDASLPKTRIPVSRPIPESDEVYPRAGEIRAPAVFHLTGAWIWTSSEKTGASGRGVVPAFVDLVTGAVRWREPQDEEIFYLDLRALCVRDKRTAPPPGKGRFSAAADKTVHDTRMQLQWTAEDNGKGKTREDASLDWSAANDHCRNLTRGGHSNWRLPFMDELLSLVDPEAPGYPLSDGSRDIVRLPKEISVSGSLAWTGDTQKDEAAIVDLVTGELFWVSWSDVMVLFDHEGRALCVRDPRFAVKANGTLEDTKQKLLWSGTDNGEGKEVSKDEAATKGFALSWAEATHYCEELKLGGHSDWRLPTPKEAAGLWERTHPGYVPMPGEKAKVYVPSGIVLSGYGTWTSSASGETASFVTFANGTDSPHKKEERGWYSRALCVRALAK